MVSKPGAKDVKSGEPTAGRNEDLSMDIDIADVRSVDGVDYLDDDEIYELDDDAFLEVDFLEEDDDAPLQRASGFGGDDVFERADGAPRSFSSMPPPPPPSSLTHFSHHRNGSTASSDPSSDPLGGLFDQSIVEENYAEGSEPLAFDDLGFGEPSPPASLSTDGLESLAADPSESTGAGSLIPPGEEIDLSLILGDDEEENLLAPSGPASYIPPGEEVDLSLILGDDEDDSMADLLAGLGEDDDLFVGEDDKSGLLLVSSGDEEPTSDQGPVLVLSTDGENQTAEPLLLLSVDDAIDEEDEAMVLPSVGGEYQAEAEAPEEEAGIAVGEDVDFDDLLGTSLEDAFEESFAASIVESLSQVEARRHEPENASEAGIPLNHNPLGELQHPLPIMGAEEESVPGPTDEYPAIAELAAADQLDIDIDDEGSMHIDAGEDSMDMDAVGEEFPMVVEDLEFSEDAGPSESIDLNIDVHEESLPGENPLLALDPLSQDVSHNANIGSPPSLDEPPILPGMEADEPSIDVAAMVAASLLVSGGDAELAGGSIDSPPLGAESVEDDMLEAMLQGLPDISPSEDDDLAEGLPESEAPGSMDRPGKRNTLSIGRLELKSSSSSSLQARAKRDLERKNQELEGQCLALEVQLEQTRSQLQEKTSLLDALQKQVESLQSAPAAAESDHTEALQKELDSLRFRIQTLEPALDQAREKLEEQRKQAVQLKQEHSRAIADADRAARHQQNAEERAKKLDEIRKGLEERLASLEISSGRHEREKTQLQDENKRLQKDLAQNHGEIHSAEIASRKMHQEQEKVQGELKLAQEGLVALQGQLQALQQELYEVSEARDALQEKADELEWLQRKFEKVSAERDFFMRSQASISIERTSLQDQVTRLTEERDTLLGSSDKLSSLQTALTGALAAKTLLEDQKSAQVQEAETLRQKLVEAENNAERLTATIGEMQNALSETMGEQEALLRQHEDVTARAMELQHALQDRSEGEDNLKLALHKAETSRNELHAQLSAAQESSDKASFALNEAREALTSLQAEHQTLLEKNTELDGRLTETVETHQALLQDHTGLQTQHQELHQQNEMLRMDLEEAEDEYQTLEVARQQTLGLLQEAHKRLEEANQAHTSLTAAQTKGEEALKNLQEQVEGLQREKSVLEDVNNTLAAEKTALEEALQALTEEKENLQARTTALEEEKTTLEAQNQSLSAEVESLQSTQSETDERLSATKANAEEAQKALHTSLETEQGKVASLEEERANLQTSLRNLTEEHRSLKVSSQSLAEERDNLQDAVQNLAEERDELHKAVEDNQTQAETWGNERQSLLRQRDELLNQGEELARQCDDLDGQIEEMVEQTEALLNEQDRLVGMVNALTEDRDAKARELQGAQEQVTNMLLSEEEQREGITALQGLLKSKENALQSLTGEHSRISEEFDEASMALDLARQRAGKQVEEISRLRIELETTRQNAAAQNAERATSLRNAQDRVVALEEEIQSLQGQLNASKAQTQDEAQELQLEIATLKGEILSLRGSASEEAQELQLEIATLKGEMLSLREAAAEAKASQSASEDDLQDENASLRDEMESLRFQLKEAEELAQENDRMRRMMEQSLSMSPDEASAFAFPTGLEAGVLGALASSADNDGESAELRARVDSLEEENQSLQEQLKNLRGNARGDQPLWKEYKARNEELQSQVDALTLEKEQVQTLRDEYSDLAEAYEIIQSSHLERGKQLMSSLATGERMRANLVRIAQELSAVREEADQLAHENAQAKQEKAEMQVLIQNLNGTLRSLEKRSHSGGVGNGATRPPAPPDSRSVTQIPGLIDDVPAPSPAEMSARLSGQETSPSFADPKQLMQLADGSTISVNSRSITKIPGVTEKRDEPSQDLLQSAGITTHFGLGSTPEENYSSIFETNPNDSTGVMDDVLPSSSASNLPFRVDEDDFAFEEDQDIYAAPSEEFYAGIDDEGEDPLSPVLQLSERSTGDSASDHLLDIFESDEEPERGGFVPPVNPITVIGEDSGMGAVDFANSVEAFEPELEPEPEEVDPVDRLQLEGWLRKTPVANFGTTTSLDSRAVYLMTNADGSTTVEDLIDLSGLPMNEAAYLVVDLIDRGALRI